MPTDPTILTHIAQHLDKHLLLPMLRFAAEKTTVAEHRQQFQAAISQLLSQTSIMDDANPTIQDKAPQLETKFARLLKATGALQDLYFTNTEEAGLRLKYVGKDFHDALRQGKFALHELDHKGGGVKAKQIKALYDVAFLLVESGNYEQAADALKVHNVLTVVDDPAADAETNQRNASALWGQYLCDVLLGYTDASRADLEALQKLLEERPADVGNHARCALLHWSLFHYFKRRESTALLDLVFLYDRNDRSKTYIYSNVIQCLAPHLLRYVAVAAVLNKKKKATLYRAARLLDAESYQYSDPFTRFLTEICINTNFNKATALLAECDQELAQDYFCCELRDDFIANARQMIFEDQLRVKQTLSIANAAQQLGLPVDKTELWLVDLIREAKLDATVDSVDGVVRVNGASTQKTVWRHVMDRLESATGSKSA